MSPEASVVNNAIVVSCIAGVLSMLWARFIDWGLGIIPLRLWDLKFTVIYEVAKFEFACPKTCNLKGGIPVDRIHSRKGM